MKRAMSVCLILATISGCCGARTVAPFDAPDRPDLVGLTPSEILETPESVLDKMDKNILETQGYVLKVECRVKIANGEDCA